jgi:hypothetical protein
LAATIDFYRAVIIPAGDVQINDGDLEDAAVKLTDLSFFGIPGVFQRFMGLKILARVEQAETFRGLRMQRSVAEIVR